MFIEQASPNDPVTAVALEGLLETCPILQDVDFFTRTGSSALVKTAREGAVPTSIFRSLNESKTGTPPTPNYDTIAKKIVSIEARVDKILEQRNEDPVAELALQTKLEAREAGWVMQDKVFHGDDGSDPEEFDGFDNIVNGSWDLSLASNGYTDGLQVPVGNSDTNVSLQQQFIEEIQKLIERVRGGASHLYMPATLKIRLVTVAKNLGYYRQGVDRIGQPVDQINDTILRSAGYKKDGSSVVPFTETVGGSTDCASIYAVRWGEGVDLTALTSQGLVGEYNGLVTKFYENDVNMDMALVLQDPTALVKQKGYRL